MKRLILLFALTLGLAGCEDGFKDLQEVPPPMGRFLLGHAVAVADDAVIGPLSRTATAEEWEEPMKAALEERFGRYDGDKYFHIAVKIEGYTLALPGVPLVASPKSVLIIGVTLWDDEKGTKINPEPKRFTVFERVSGATFISSGLTQSKAVQIENLTKNAALQIQNWMLENVEWFGDASLMDPETTSAGFPALPAEDAEAPESTTEATDPALSETN